MVKQAVLKTAGASEREPSAGRFSADARLCSAFYLRGVEAASGGRVMVNARQDYNERVQDSAGLIPSQEPVFLIRGQDEVGHLAVRACTAAGARVDVK